MEPRLLRSYGVCLPPAQFKQIKARGDAISIDEIREKYTGEELRDKGGESAILLYWLHMPCT